MLSPVVTVDSNLGPYGHFEGSLSPIRAPGHGALVRRLNLQLAVLTECTLHSIAF